MAVFFGGKGYDAATFDSIAAGLVDCSTPVIPAVTTLDDFPDQVPPKIRPINGFKIGTDLNPLASRALELLHLLRDKRRIFLSYRRKESRNAALQLYQELEAKSFDTFLDTHSVQPAVEFQSELWHRMADSDLIVLLYTPEVLASDWVHQELTQADSMGVTILQIIWPGVTRDRRTELFYPHYLSDSDLEMKLAPEGGLRLRSRRSATLLPLIESLRARALRSREVKLIDKLCELSREAGVTVTLQPGTSRIELENKAKS